MRRLLILLTLLAPALASAQALKVLSAGAIKPMVLAVAAEFEARTGTKVDVQNDTAGALLKRIQGGERFDLAILTDAGARRAAADGQAARAEALARVGIGMAVKRGAPLPPLADVEDFKRAILGARKLAYIDPQAGGSSGIYLQGLFQRLGLTDAVAAKAVLVPGGLTAQRILDGQADLAVQQASELAIVDGVVLVGMLPDAIQNFTTYAWALGRDSRAGDSADALAQALSQAAAAGRFKGIGMLPVTGP